MFARILIPAIRNSASRIRLNVSNEKVENVVNPPQKPTPISNLIVGLTSSFSSSPNIKNPRIKLPKTLTINVPYGKNIGRYLDAKEETQYLKEPPRPAPRNTVMYFNNHTSEFSILITNLSIYRFLEKLIFLF